MYKTFGTFSPHVRKFHTLPGAPMLLSSSPTVWLTSPPPYITRIRWSNCPQTALIPPPPAYISWVIARGRGKHQDDRTIFPCWPISTVCEWNQLLALSNGQNVYISIEKQKWCKSIGNIGYVSLYDNHKRKQADIHTPIHTNLLLYLLTYILHTYFGTSF